MERRADLSTNGHEARGEIAVIRTIGLVVQCGQAEDVGPLLVQRYN